MHDGNVYKQTTNKNVLCVWKSGRVYSVNTILWLVDAGHALPEDNISDKRMKNGRTNKLGDFYFVRAFDSYTPAAQQTTNRQTIFFFIRICV